jgi:hypothetical protein
MLIAHAPERSTTLAEALQGTLLILGSLPVIGIGFANSKEIFCFFAWLLVLGASFIILQYNHTSVLFAPQRSRHRQSHHRRPG